MIYQLTITTLLKKDLHFRESSYRIGQLINKSLLGEKALKDKHKRNEYKYYVFDNLYPRSKDKFYKKSRIYIFNIRTPIEYIYNILDELLSSTETDFFTILSISKKQLKEVKIKEIVTITPAVMTLKNSYWTIDKGLQELENGINNNILKKYKRLYDEKDDLKDEKFFYDMQVLNRKPIGIKYKNINFLGNKIELKIKEDKTSQQLAQLAAAAGILEKNSSCGMGYCIYKSK